jgi:hypothetical protein
LSRFQHQSPEVQDRIFFTGLLLVAIPVLWLLPLGASFWRDETGTVWNIKTDLSTALATRWMGQSPLYHAIAWAAVALGGIREYVVRLPSVLAMAGAAFLLYRIALRFFERGTALFSVVVFVCLQDVAFAAADARTYALSVLAVNASMLLLLRWLDQGGILGGVAYAASAACVVYGHYLFAPLLIVEGAYALYRIKNGSPVRLWAFLAAAVLAGLLVLPLIPSLIELLGVQGQIHYGGSVSIFELLRALTPPVVAGPVLLGLALAFALRPYQSGSWQVRRDYFLLICAWAFFVPVLYFLMSTFLGLEVFIPRYLLCCASGFALLATAAVSGVCSGRSRRIVAATAVTAAILAFGVWRSHGNEDWRGALAAVRSATAGSNEPVLLASPFIEGADPEKIADPNQRQLFAPVEVYPIGGRFIRLPMMTATVNAGFLDQVANNDLRGQTGFLLITAQESASYQAWFMGRFADRLLPVEELGDFGTLSVLRFRFRP